MKLRSAHDPINFWIHRDGGQYLALPYRMMAATVPEGEPGKDLMGWYGNFMTHKFFAEDVVFTLGWNQGMGFHAHNSRFHSAQEKPRGKVALVVDSSGLAIFGEGQRSTAQHGRRGFQGWRKTHLGFEEAGTILGQAQTGLPQ